MTVANRPPSADPKKLLIKELAAVGLKKDVLQALPEWWEDALAHPSGVYEIRGFVAKHCGLEIGPNGLLHQRRMPDACFKTRTGTDIAVVASARAMATAVARIVAGATVCTRPAGSNTPWSGGLPRAANLRRAVLDGERPWVGLSDLLAICWKNGIPVVYLPSLPVSKPKMDGMVTFCGGRPVILVTKKADQPAWMLFVLAHEMGHLALSHLDECDGGAIVDEKVSEDELGVADPQEVAANAYALQLLTGDEKGGIHLPSLMKAAALAEAATRFGREHHIDPGHVVLNAVRNTTVNGQSPWALGNKALKHLDREEASSVLCREALRRNIDVDALSDDSFDFLERLGVL